MRKITHHIKLLSPLLIAANSVTQAFATTTIDFSGSEVGQNFVEGDIISNQYSSLPESGMTVTADSGSVGGGKPLIYDSRFGQGSDQDPDLEFSNSNRSQYNGGNSATVNFGNLFILQEAGSVIADDAAGGGILRLAFSRPLESFGFSFIDLDDASGETTWVSFTDPSGTKVSFFLEEFEDDLTPTPYLRSGVVHADGNANTYSPISLAEIRSKNASFGQIETVGFDLSSSGGIGDLTFTAAAIPEPSTLVLLGFGALGLVRRKR